jgi:flagellar M-ring protein FliF
LNSVRNARVHLVLPQRQLFSRERQEPSASVALKVRTPGRLPAEQVASIQHLVAAAVPGLDPRRISIVDDRGNLLASGDDSGTGLPMAQDLDQRRIAHENRMARTIEQLLEKSVGMGKVRAEVSADMDFSRLSTTEETYDPEGQVVRSTQTVDEDAQSTEAEGTPPVTVATNLPDQGAGAEGARATTQETRSEETVNFEISKKVTNHIREFGEVRRISVAVLVDGIVTTDAQGAEVYQARAQEEMDNLAKLVSSTIGFNAERGDTIEVINMRFAPVAVDFEEPLDLFFGLQKNDLLRFAEVIVLLILAILVILLVVRPLLSRAFEALPAAAAAAEQRLLAEQAAARPVLTGPERPPEEEGYEELIDIDRVEGRVRASSVKKVGEIVEKHPEEALSIIRAWMYQEA